MASQERVVALTTSTNQHQIIVDYPVSQEDFEVAAEDVVILPVDNSTERYEPRPLISDPNVADVAFRNSPQETVFFSYRAAYFQANENMRPSLHIYPNQAKVLVEHIEFLRIHAGNTALNLLTYKKEDGESEDANIWVKVGRRTTFWGTDNDERFVYDMSLEQLLEVLNRNDLWMQNIRDLLFRQSDRAVLRVALNLRRFPEVLDVSVWKDPRHPDFDSVVEGRMHEAGEDLIPKSGERCGICLEDMFPDDDAILLPCRSRKHAFHRPCLIRICQVSDHPQNVACPICRNPIFLDEEDLMYLKYGMIGGQYSNDNRFNDWENFERGCADLDKVSAFRHNGVITVDKDILMAAFDHIVDGAKKEPKESTPLHLQLARSAEVSLFRQAVKQCSTTFHSSTIQARLLHQQLVLEVHQVFAQSWLSGKNNQLLSDAARNRLQGSPATQQSWTMPPGFPAFVLMTLNRTVMFFPVRKCPCEESAPGKTHTHDSYGEDGQSGGARLYHKPGPETRPAEKVFGKESFWEQS